jgi:hypothetical protein
MSVPQWLPTELWKHIFRYATAEESQFHETGYLPFQPMTPRQSQPQIALALSRVSKQWQAIAAEFLFREVWLGHGAQGLLESLKGSQLLSEGCGRYVRRLELPSKLVHHDIANPIRLLNILACCPHLQILVKRSFTGPQDAEFWSNLIPAAHPRANDVVLKSLERIEWSGSHGDGLILEACGSVLSDLVFRSPNLRYLSISWPGPIFRDLDRDAYPHLPPSLTAWRRRSYGGPDSAGIEPDDIPRLTHLICDPINLSFDSVNFEHGDSSVLDIAVSELHVLEFCRDLHDIYGLELNEFLERCPKLQELAYHVGFPRTILLNALQSLELKRVNLRIESLDDLRQHYGSNDEWFWRSLGVEFAHLYGHALPALERVILHGDWDYIVYASQFRPLRQRLLDRGCSLEYPNGKPVQ